MISEGGDLGNAYSLPAPPHPVGYKGWRVDKGWRECKGGTKHRCLNLEPLPTQELLGIVHLAGIQCALVVLAHRHCGHCQNPPIDCPPLSLVLPPNPSNRHLSRRREGWRGSEGRMSDGC